MLALLLFCLFLYGWAVLCPHLALPVLIGAVSSVLSWALRTLGASNTTFIAYTFVTTSNLLLLFAVPSS